MCSVTGHIPDGALRPVQPSTQERGWIAYLTLVLLAVLLVIPSNLGTQPLHDSLAIYWVWADQFTAELSRGNLYPRWLPLSNDGLGTPVFYYYPPLAFHVSGIFGLLGLSTYASLVATFSSAFAASGIACWHWLKGRTNHPLVGAAFFMAAPYHLFDYTVRGALAETLAIAFIPLIAIGLRRITEGRGGIILTAAAYGGIICTHLPLALLVSIFLIAPWSIRHRSRLPGFSVAVAAGIGLAAIYLLPALALEPYHDVSQLYRAPNLTTAYYSLYAGNWGDGVVLSVFLITAALATTAVALAVKHHDGWAMYALAICIAVAGIIPFLWSLPLIEKIQFPYRALPLAEFALATAIAASPFRPGRWAYLAALPLLLSLAILPGFGLRGGDLAYLQTHHPDVYEYLPRGVITPGTVTKLRDVVGPRLPPPQVPGMVVEPHFYFPSWSCGQAEPRTQLLMHEPSCSPRIMWTPIEKISAAISFGTGLLLIACTAFAHRRHRRHTSPIKFLERV